MGQTAEEQFSIPDLATHYYVAGRAPFLNLSDLSDDQRQPVLTALELERASGTSWRVFGRRYMALRQQTEAKLRRLFIQSGGQPVRTSPHYFVLGTSDWYAGLAKKMETVTVRLSDLPSAVTSFTYPDSFTAMGLGMDFGLSRSPQPYHDQVYRLEQLRDIVETYGLPSPETDGYAGYASKAFEYYIEIQLWADDLVSAHMAANTPGS